MMPNISLGALSLIVILIAAIGMCAGFIGLEIANRRERIRTRIAGVAGGPRNADLGPAPGEALFQRLQVIGSTLLSSPLLGAAERQKIAGKLVNCGIRDPNALSIFVGVKFGLAIGVPALIWGLLHYFDYWPTSFATQLPVALGTTLFGWRAPDMWLDRRIKEWRLLLSDGLPDALDLMVICTDAGLGLEQAMDRVARDIEMTRPVLAMELRLTLSEMRVLPAMKDALINLSNRTQSRPIQMLVSTLVQTLQYGTPLGQSLRTLSAEMHIHRFLQYEQNAAKLPVLLTLPMVIFILPTMFIVVCGPAALQVMDVVKNMN
jgi:tight adherence protein C